MRILTAISLVLLLFGCKKPADRPCWKAHGEAISETRDLGSFSHVKIEDHMNVVLVEDSIFSITIEAGENVVPFVHSVVESDTLVLSDLNKCSFVRSYKKEIQVVISMPTLEYLIQKSTGDISNLDTLHLQSLKFRGNFSAGDLTLVVAADSMEFLIEGGPSDVYLSGTANHLYFYHSGNGYARAKNLLTKEVHLNHTSTGDFHVTAQNKLIAEMFGTGNVYYSGTVSQNNVFVSGNGSGTVQAE